MIIWGLLVVATGHSTVTAVVGQILDDHSTGCYLLVAVQFLNCRAHATFDVRQRTGAEAGDTMVFGASTWYLNASFITPKEISAFIYRYIADLITSRSFSNLLSRRID